MCKESEHNEHGQKTDPMTGVHRCLHMYRTRGAILSIVIHATALLLVIYFCGQGYQKSPELVTILLSNETLPTPVSGTAGGEGRKPGSAGRDKKASGGTPRTALRGIVQPHKSSAEKTLPSARENKKEDNVVLAKEPSDMAVVTAPPPTSERADNLGHNATAGIGDGPGGGGGTGTGAYGTGSGFGGRGKGGIGGGRGSGTGRGSSNPDDAKRQYLREHYGYIRDLLYKHLAYPSMAKKMGWTGDVIVSFVILETGFVEAIKVVRSSGHAVLDQNVVDTVKDVQPFPKPPVPAHLQIPITYNLDRT